MPRATLTPALPLPRLALAAPALFTSRRRRPSRHDSCRLPAPAPARPRLLLDPEHLLELPTHPFLPSRDYISTTFSSLEHHPSPDLRHSLGSPSSAAHTASEPRSSAVIAPPRPTGAPQPNIFHSPVPKRHLPQRQWAQSSAAARPRRRPTDTEPVHPSQGHQQHHINP
jgi:hypothetical protein